MESPAMSPSPSLSYAASASPIVVPRRPELVDDSAASSPAITTLGNTLAPPSVSPLAPSVHPLHGDYTITTTSSGSQVMKAKAVMTKSQAGMNGGRWTEQEHQSFLAGLRLYGREWKKVASKIKTRTSAQIRSHAQKYFAKLARDDETRKLGSSNGLGGLPSHLTGADGGVASLYGYMSDDGSSTTAGNLSGDEAADDTDSNASNPPSASASASAAVTPAPTVLPQLMSPPSHRSILPVHPFPSPMLSPPTAGLSINALFHPRNTGSLVVTATTTTKKRSRPLNHDLLSPLHSSSSSFKQLKGGNGDAVPFHRLPSPEELVETVSPTVRQRLASLIEAEISALQVLSCITWLQQQHQQQQHQQQHGDLKVQLQAPPPMTSSSVTSANANAAVFPASSLAMFAAERSPSIF